MSKFMQQKTLGIPNLYLIVAVIFVLFGTSYGIGIRQRAIREAKQAYEEITGEPAVPGVKPGKYDRNMITVALVINLNDWQAGGSASPTNGVYKFFQGKPTAAAAGISLTAAGTDIEVKAANDGIVWLDLYGGDDFYIVESALVASNEEIKSVSVEDYDDDGKEDFLAELDLSQFLVGSVEFKPGYTLSLPLLDLDVTGLTSTNPADSTGIGTSETVVNKEWTLSAITAEDGAFLTELYFTTNSTQEGEDIKLEELYIGGQWDFGGKTSFNDPARTTYGNYAAWYIEAEDNNDYLSSGAVMVYRDTNRADTCDVSLNVRCTLDSGDVLSITLNAVFVDPTGSKTTVTDAVLFKQA